jgi:hypothetical protein
VLARILALLDTVANPFVQVRLDSAWAPPPSEVGGINAAAFEACCQAIEDVRATHQSHGLLLSGQAGAGKTHLLARVRHWLHAGQRGSFVYVLPMTAPERFHRHALQAVASDMLRLPPETCDLSQIEIAIGRHLMSDHGASVEAIAQWWTRVREVHPLGAPLADFLQAALEPVAEALELDASVVRALVAFVARVHRAEARAWLLGRPLTDAHLELLGVAESLDEESSAEVALVTLLRFAGDLSTIVLAFDQIEGFQSERGDARSLLAWAHGVTGLMSRTRNLAVLTCALVSFLDDLRQAIPKSLFDGRIAERQSSLRTLMPADALSLVQSRMVRSEDLQAVRLAYRERRPEDADAVDDLWPLRSAEIATLSARPDLAARPLLLDCRELFDRRRAELQALAPPHPPIETLDDVWDRALAEIAGSPLDKIDEGEYADGLLKVVEAVGHERLKVRRPQVPDVDLVVESEGERVAVAVCHAQDARSLAARLRRLSTLDPAHGFSRLVLVRDQRLPISTAAVRTQEYLRKLTRHGATLVRPPAEAYAALAALRRLLNAAAAGDLTLNGKEMTQDGIREWLQDHLPVVVRDLLDAVTARQAPPGEDDTSDLERVQSLLGRDFLATSESIARESGLSTDQLVRLVARYPRVVGRLEGTPELLYLHADAIARD